MKRSMRDGLQVHAFTPPASAEVQRSAGRVDVPIGHEGGAAGVENGLLNGAEDGCRLLVVDDNEDVRRLVRMMLDGDESIQIVGEAENGEVGIAMARLCRPDVIVLDINMPVMDGFAALPEIRRVAPEAAIVIWTASAPEDGAEQRALDLGANAFLQKAGNDPLAILYFIKDQCAGRGTDAGSS